MNMRNGSCEGPWPESRFSMPHGEDPAAIGRLRALLFTPDLSTPVSTPAGPGR